MKKCLLGTLWFLIFWGTLGTTCAKIEIPHEISHNAKNLACKMSAYKKETLEWQHLCATKIEQQAPRGPRNLLQGQGISQVRF